MGGGGRDGVLPRRRGGWPVWRGGVAARWLGAADGRDSMHGARGGAEGMARQMGTGVGLLARRGWTGGVGADGRG